MNERLTRIIGGVIAAILLLDLVAIAGWSDAHRHTPTWQTRNALPASFTGVPDLEHFVERARGLRFKQPVDVELVDQQALNDARHKEDALSGIGSDMQPITRPDDGAVLGVMSLLPKATNVDQTVNNDEDQRVVGLYFPRQKRLLVVGQDQTPFVREVLVHELTHALDDQYFNLERDSLALHDDEAMESWHALGEGDATSVEEQYLASLSPAERQQALQEREGVASQGGAGAPTAIDTLLAYPYIAGAAFVDALREAGGNHAVNNAFRHPPTTSEQILRPDHYLSHDVPAVVTKPTPLGPAVGRGVFGVLQLTMLLSNAVDIPTIHAALDGWNGDRYVVWTEAGRTCLADNVDTDSAAAAGKLADAFRGWLAHNPSGTVTVEGDVVKLQRCA